MDRGPGVLLVVAAALVVLVTAFVLRPRLPAAVVAAVLAVGGAAIGAGGAMIEGETGPEQAVAASLILAVLTPLHVAVVLGPLGRRT